MLISLAVDPQYSDEQIDAMYDLVSAITGLSVDDVIDAIYDDDEEIYVVGMYESEKKIS